MMESQEHKPSAASAEEIFLGALELAPGALREDFLRQSCAGDEALLQAVRELLRDHEAATDLFRESARQIVDEGDALPDESTPPGTRIGPYRILRQIGEGGSSSVYEAGQEEPIRRTVALKILKADTDTQRFVSLFETERQTLALMEHPNIARVLDAGRTEDDRPFFTMDLVHGTRITQYCEDHRLPVGERLLLMRQVCAAVQHAHNKGVIHRDLKPSNVLVEQVDGVAIPKVIDFGIARASALPVDPGESGPARVQWIGTPAYMSPEQFGSPEDIDTRSDVYSLGVVLYELVAGRPPFDNNALLLCPPGEISRRIREESVPPPSSWRKMAGTGSAHELDCIILKAIEKDRDRRYLTVQDLSSDLDRFLRGEPLEAHPARRIYRLRKLILRNRLATASIVAVVLALATGFSTSTLLYFRARAAEREQAHLRAESEEREHVTKAAIFIMQGKFPEADAEVAKMGGVLTQPSLEATNVFRELGVQNAIRENWKTSADRWLALSRVNHFDESDLTDHATRDLLPIAPTLVRVGDHKRYAEFQDLLIRRLGKTDDPVAAEQVLKLCLQAPASPSLLARLKPVAQVAEASLSADFDSPPANRLEAWRCVALGLWHYRGGRYDEAVRWCSRTLLWGEKDDDIARTTNAILLRGMARRAAGDFAGADGDFALAKGLYVRRFSLPHELNTNGSWYGWLTNLNFFTEAGIPMAHYPTMSN
jgi:serine/threonine protein kinase